MKGKRIFKTSISIASIMIVLLASVMAYTMPVIAADEVKPVVTNIKIDGKFSDWDGVVKKENYSKFLQEAAMVWVDDTVYVYFKEQTEQDPQDYPYDGNIHKATPKKNGNFSIITNGGSQRTSFYVTQQGVRIENQHSGDMLEYKYSNHMYEIAIPANKIHGYSGANTLSLGVTETDDILISSIAKVSTTETDDTQEDDNNSSLDIRPRLFKIDGDFTEWQGYPGTRVDYSNGGGNGNDAFACLYSDGDTLFAYVNWNKNRHSYNNELGYFQLAINGDYDDKHTLQLGTYENWLYLGAYNTSNRTRTGVYGPSDPTWSQGRLKYGDMEIKVDAAGEKYVEYSIDLAMVASYYGISQEDIKQIDVKYVNLGNQWVSCAGTSTGPIVGVLTCIIVAGVGIIIYELERRKKKTINQEG